MSRPSTLINRRVVMGAVLAAVVVVLTAGCLYKDKGQALDEVPGPERAVSLHLGEVVG